MHHGWYQGCPQVGPGQVSTRPELNRYFQVDKIKTRNRLRILIRSASSGRFRFWVVSVNFKFRHGGRDLARSVEIWPDPSRSSRYLAKIHGDLADIWPDPSRSHRILKDLDQISTRSCQIWFVSRRTEDVIVIPSGFETQNHQTTHTFWVLTSKTHYRPQVALIGLASVPMVLGRLVLVGHRFTQIALNGILVSLYQLK